MVVLKPSQQSPKIDSAIVLNHIEDIDENHWALKLLQSHIDRIEKLTFNSCTFKSSNIFSEPLNIKHLTFRNHSFSSPDRIFNSFKHLESLALSVGNYTIQILRQFGKKCKQIKHLGLRLSDDYYDLNAMFDLAESFHQIESLHYYHDDSYLRHTIEQKLIALIEHLPNLRHLCVESNQQYDIGSSMILSLQQKCPSLQQIIIVFKYRCDENLRHS